MDNANDNEDNTKKSKLQEFIDNSANPDTKLPMSLGPELPLALWAESDAAVPRKARRRTRATSRLDCVCRSEIVCDCCYWRRSKHWNSRPTNLGHRA
jgi:hypothetical protein